MYVLWRYLGQGFFRIFALSIGSFISILLVSRFKEIARFAALSADWGKTTIFFAYQVPLILPIAIPISALIASLFLFQRLSRTFELTALRSSGISLSSLLTPVLFISLALSVFNFSFCSEISPYCRRESKSLLYYETTTNPLLLLQRQNLVRVKRSFVKMKVEEEGKSAKDLYLITHNPSNERLSLVSAKKLHVGNSETENSLIGENVAVITHLRSESGDTFDPLVLENQSSMATDAASLSSSLKKNRPRLEPAALEFPLLKIRSENGGKAGKKARVEMLRRVSLSLSVFSFTLLGSAFGIELGRKMNRKNLLAVLSLALCLIMSYLFGKELKGHPLTAIFILFLPHLLIWAAGSLKLHCISKGSA